MVTGSTCASFRLLSGMRKQNYRRLCGCSMYIVKITAAACKIIPTLVCPHTRYAFRCSNPCLLTGGVRGVGFFFKEWFKSEKERQLVERQMRKKEKQRRKQIKDERKIQRQSSKLEVSELSLPEKQNGQLHIASGMYMYVWKHRAYARFIGLSVITFLRLTTEKEPSERGITMTVLPWLEECASQEGLICLNMQHAS